MDFQKLKNQFTTLYGKDRVMVYFAPGRVNLIGEHTDYNGGFVLPCPLEFGTYLLIRENGTDKVRLSTMNFPYSAEIPLNEISRPHGNEWVNYPLGVFDQFVKHGIQPRGVDLLFSGNIPNGAGLSSSASIEMVTTVALNDLLGGGLSKIDQIKIGRAAENEFVGMNCGIMDQFVITMGKANSALFLNCRSLEYELVSMDLKGYFIIIANSNKRRELAGSKYNERVAECTEALKILSQYRPLIDLSDMELDEFLTLQEKISSETIRKRAHHVISENYRVLQAVNALKSGDLTTFGSLMNKSHASLKHDYEVTGFELDTLVEEAQKIPGILGARMTGAGFGGCTVNLIRNSSVDEFITSVGQEYRKKTGLEATFYVASIGNGAGRLE
jgi:galactokinase